MLNQSHHQPEGSTTGVVIDLFAKKRDRLSKRFGELHPALRPQQATQDGRATLASVTPIDAVRHRRGPAGG